MKKKVLVVDDSATARQHVAKQAGAKGLIVKPFKATQLVAAVRKLTA